MYARSHMLPLGLAMALSAVPTLSHALSAAPDFNVPGIAEAGFPHFSDSATITLTRQSVADGNGYVLTSSSTGVTGPFVFQYSPTQSWNVVGTFNLTANFDSSRTFTGGTVDITGTIPSYSGPGDAGTISTTSQNLFHANLSAFAADTSAPANDDALGFTTDRSSFSGWSSQFASGADESVYLYGFNVKGLMSMFTNSKFKSGLRITFTGKAITTVPIPAAVWLFGSSLAFLSGVSVRRKSKSVSA